MEFLSNESLCEWYSRYRAMVYPRSVGQELEYKCLGGSENDLEEGTKFWLEILKAKISKKSNLKMNSISNSQATISFFEWAGALKTLKDTKVKKDFVVNKIIDDVNKLFLDEEQNILDLLQKEICTVFDSKIILWETFVKKSRYLNDTKKHDCYWDYDSQKILIYDGSKDYEVFAKEIESNQAIKVMWDYFEYKDYLDHRYMISRIINLGNQYFDCSLQIDLLSRLDTKFNHQLINTNTIISSNMQKFYPKNYFWWYYRLPQNIVLSNPNGEGVLPIIHTN